MNRYGLATLGFFTALAFSANADEPVEAELLGMDAPTVAEASEPEPEWYRQFTIAAPSVRVTDNPAIQSAPDEDVRFAWLEGKRWTFSIDLTTRPDDSPLPKEEMSAGATFQITPRISVGGDLSVGANELEHTSPWQQEDVEAGIRLRSAFRF